MHTLRLSNEEYALEFVELLPTSFICTSCHQFLGEAYQNVECGDRFCGDCVRLITNGAKKCPECSSLMTRETTFVDIAVRREISGLEVCCPFKRYDCEETLLYRNLKDHIESCSKKPVRPVVPTAIMSSATLEPTGDQSEDTIDDRQPQIDGVNSQASSSLLLNSNNTTSFAPDDADATRQIGEMTRQFLNPEEIAQGARPVYGSISSHSSADELTRPSSMSGLAVSSVDTFGVTRRTHMFTDFVETTITRSGVREDGMLSVDRGFEFFDIDISKWMKYLFNSAMVFIFFSGLLAFFLAALILNVYFMQQPDVNWQKAIFCNVLLFVTAVAAALCQCFVAWLVNK